MSEAAKGESLIKLLDMCDQNEGSLYDGELTMDSEDWKRISSALRLAMAWLGAEAGLKSAGKNRALCRDGGLIPYAKSRDDAREAFRRAVEGPYAPR